MQGSTFNARRMAGNGGAGSVSGALVRPNWRQPIRGARRDQRRVIRGAKAPRTLNMRPRIFNAIPPAPLSPYKFQSSWINGRSFRGYGMSNRSFAIPLLLSVMQIYLSIFRTAR